VDVSVGNCARISITLNRIVVMCYPVMRLGVNYLVITLKWFVCLLLRSCYADMLHDKDRVSVVVGHKHPHNTVQFHKDILLIKIMVLKIV